MIILTSLKQSKESIKDKFTKHIDIQGWKTYWPQIEAGNQEFGIASQYRPTLP
ncbi:hypothetical protein J4731_15565 [Providencia rettgeri]|nr:hypothetical protein [Providencia rettgeri]